MSEGGEEAGPAELPHPEVLAMPADRKADLELARLIGRSLSLSAQRLGIPHADISFDEMCERVVSGAQGGKLDPAAYRAAWEVLAVLAPRAS